MPSNKFFGKEGIVKKRIAVFVFLCGLTLLASTANAGLGGIPYLYGFGARGAAMGQAYTALADDASSAFFNPAAMAALPQSNLALSYVYAQPEFMGGQKGNEQRFDKSNRVVELNMAQKLNSLFQKDWDLAFGLNISLDDNGDGFIRFNDTQNTNGMFYRYGPTSFTLNAALGWKIQDWFYMGGGIMTTLHSKSTFFVNTDLAGHTSHQGITLDANLSLAPVGAFFFRFKPVDIGLTYHGKTVGGFQPITVNATADVGSSPLASLPMILYYKDNYMPQRLALGLGWHADQWVYATADIVYYGWGDFTHQAKIDDLPRQDIAFSFHDTFVPHLGLEFTPLAGEGFHIRAGYGYEESPVGKGGSSENMILDNSKHVTGFGLGYTFLNPSGLKYPLSLDASYLGQYLVKRQMVSTDNVKYECSGYLNGVAATLTLRY